MVARPKFQKRRLKFRARAGGKMWSQLHDPVKLRRGVPRLRRSAGTSFTQRFRAGLTFGQPGLRPYHFQLMQIFARKTTYLYAFAPPLCRMKIANGLA